LVLQNFAKTFFQRLFWKRCLETNIFETNEKKVEEFFFKKGSMIILEKMFRNKYF
jgi:hypothetical protein